MANFPVNPTVNQLTSFGSAIWRWDGQGWVRGSPSERPGIGLIPVGPVSLVYTVALPTLNSNMLTPINVDYI
jgi:hypothetical protein